MVMSSGSLWQVLALNLPSLVAGGKERLWRRARVLITQVHSLLWCVFIEHLVRDAVCSLPVSLSPPWKVLQTVPVSWNGFLHLSLRSKEVFSRNHLADFSAYLMSTAKPLGDLPPEAGARGASRCTGWAPEQAGLY